MGITTLKNNNFWKVDDSSSKTVFKDGYMHSSLLEKYFFAARQV
jgi:hypothetical protein